MRHRKPRGRHLGRHRAAAPPRSRYAAATTAVVGAGVVAFGVSSALPSSAPADAAAAGPVKVGGTSDAVPLTAQETATLRQTRSALVARASRSQSRLAAPRPAPGWTRPAVGPISSMFGMRWGSMHRGVDIAAPYGSTVRAAYGGTVKKVGWYGGYGKIVIIDHGDGLETYYGHNSEILVTEGQKVRAGMPVAKVGSTGHSTGPHCHFEVLLNGERVDPMPYLRKRGLDLTADPAVRT